MDSMLRGPSISKSECLIYSYNFRLYLSYEGPRKVTTNSEKYTVVCNLANDLQESKIWSECLVRVFESFLSPDLCFGPELAGTVDDSYQWKFLQIYMLLFSKPERFFFHGK